MVLVIDADATVATLIEGLLRAAGERDLSVRAVASLAGAEAAIELRRPSVVMLDADLPGAGGVAAIRALRNRGLELPPIVVLAGDGDRELELAAIREGAEDFLRKRDLSSAVLARSIRYAIERGRFRRETLRSERLVRDLLDSISSLVAVVDADGSLIAANGPWRRAAERFGGVLLERGLPPAGHSDLGSADVCAGIRSVLAGERGVAEADLRLRDSADEQAYRARIVRMWGGGQAAAIILADEATAHAETARALRMGTEQLEMALDAGQIGVWDWDLITNQISWTDWHFRIFGISREEFAGTYESFARWVPPEDVAEIDRRLAEARRTGEQFVYEYRVLRPDGSVRWVEGIGRVVERTALGEARRMSGVVVDVTERRMRATRHAQSQRLEALGELSAGVAHDLTHLLALTAGAIQRIEQILPGDGEHRAPLLDLRLAAEQSRQLTGSLLAFAGPQRARPLETIDLGRTAADMVSFLRRVLPSRLRVVTDIADPRAWIVAPPVQIQQILLNLLVNARDALPEGGDVRVAVRTEGSERVLEVSDDGPGLPEAVRAHLFEPSLSERGGLGLGLGLAIVRSIVEATGGRIEVPELRGGAVFRMCWPAAPPPDQPAARPARPAAADGGRRTVAVVGGDDYIRQLLVDGLAESGFEAISLATADELRGWISGERRQPSLVLAEAGLSGGSGFAGLSSSGYAGQVLWMVSHDEEIPLGSMVVRKPFTVGGACRAVRMALESNGG